ncbi:MAG: hypothetical protein JXA37_06130 [Chloroflexia bacterium]|nr:hypothetical protein [Chloroflexia bacterium]
MHEAIIRSWGYDEDVSTFLLTLNKGAAVYQGRPSTAGELLRYVQRQQPPIRWSTLIDQLGFAGFTLPIPGNYLVLLNPKHVRPDERLAESTGTLGHELGHALWNSHGFDSTEEEYYCDRIGGKVYQQVLMAQGWSEAEAAEKAARRYVALAMSLEDWTARRRKNVARHALKPWTWCDRRTSADLLSSLFFPYANLGLWGPPFWISNRKLGE